VIREKAQSLVAKHHPRCEDGLIPLGHRFELPGPQHEMGEFGRADRLRNRSELACRSYVVHRKLPCSMVADSAPEVPHRITRYINPRKCELICVPPFRAMARRAAVLRRKEPQPL